MKLRLHVSTTPQSTFHFEHSGPDIRVGRDPAGEIVLDGEACQQVSWNHLLVELTSRGAFLNDLGSTNGTLLNDKRIAVRTPLKQGDRIQLGHTGPSIKVIEVDTSDPPVLPIGGAPSTRHDTHTKLPESQETSANGDRRRLDRPAVSDRAAAVFAPGDKDGRGLVIGLGIGAVVVAAILVGLFLNRGEKPPPTAPATQVAEAKPAADPPAPPAASPPAAETKSDVAPPAAESGTKTPKKSNKQGEGRKDSSKQRPTVAAAVPPPAPIEESKDLGRYDVPAKSPPSVLLQRERVTAPWARLRPNGRLHSGYQLVSLPGYRSKLDLDSGVQLVLWGNVPEFSSAAPVLESEVVLHAPPAGVDADVSLDHGRIHLMNYKPKAGPAVIRVHFQSQVWDVTLPDPKSEAVLELWSLYPPGEQFTKDSGGKGPLACLGLFAKGPVKVKVGSREIDMADMTQLVWTNRSSTLVGPDKLPQAPSWWTDRILPDKEHPEVADVMLALSDYNGFVGEKDSVIDVVRTKTRESSDPKIRALGVLFLGALDALPHMLDALEDYKSAQVRGTARQALQNWMSRSPDHDIELYRTLQEKKAYSPEKAEIILRLLHTFAPSDVAKPQTHQMLLDYLNHENLAIRELALWHLTWLFPDAAKAILFDPASDEDKRKPGYEQWKKYVKEKGVPSNLNRPSGS